MDFLKRIFSRSEVDVTRVNPLGLCLMAAAVLLVILSGRLARKIRPDAPEAAKNAIKILSLIICAGGALLAILG